MLEVKHLRKEYSNKKGVVTNALDDVSLTFPETGMVFILGKSGSGKSTLLNVCGGLDKCTSGEIVIKGKSSARFTSSDFDSYRNTYVGFVFQDYNILEDFTVEDNIALALELQNKKRDKAVIDKILADVDMADFASRKPNTLSGGQKQRVAIARALVKEPQIIMADEPTGALDSKTGQQVFDTLKKLSADKLVLVVSHDRDFAEQYGDRIIELKDGKVISDMTRNEQADDNNVSFFGTDTVCVKNASRVTDEDIASIRRFLSKTNGSAVITTSRERIASVKEELPELGSGDFEEIKQQPQSKQYDEQRLIRSKFPLRHAVKMGASSLKTKPVRLTFTILLSIIAFVLFGLASTLMLFDGRTVTRQSLIDANYDSIVISKAFYRKDKNYYDGELANESIEKIPTGYTEEEFSEFCAKYPNAIAAIDGSAIVENVEMNSVVRQFYTNSVEGYVLAHNGLQILAGRLPEAKDEIAITDYMFDGFAAFMTEFYYVGDNEDEKVKLTLTKGDYSKIIYSRDNPVTLSLNGDKFKIVGVFKGDNVPAEYRDLQSAADENRRFSGDFMIQGQWHEVRASGLYAKIAVTSDFAIEYCYYQNAKYEYFRRTNVPVDLDFLGENNASGLQEYIDNLSKYNDNPNVNYLQLYDLNGNKVDALPSNAMGLNSRLLMQMYVRLFDNYKTLYDEKYNAAESERIAQVVFEKMIEWENANPAPSADDYPDADDYRAACDKWSQNKAEYKQSAEMNASKLKEYRLLEYAAHKRAKQEFIASNPKPEDDTEEYWDWQRRLSMYQDEYWDACNPISKLLRLSYEDFGRDAFYKSIAEVKDLLSKMGLSLDVKISNELNDAREALIGGIYFDKRQSEYSMYLSDELYGIFYSRPKDNYTEYETKYIAPRNAYISAIHVPYNQNGAIVDDLLNKVYVRNDDDSSALILNNVMSQLDILIDMAKTLSTAFLIAGLSLACFAFLLMFNFISASISYKKREIGILRAIGARTADVFKIFLSEALIIALICFALSTAASWGLCTLLNSVMTDGTILNVSLFVFGPLSALCILGIALLTAVLSTVIPVALYSRKPPVSSIRAL